MREKASVTQCLVNWKERNKLLDVQGDRMKPEVIAALLDTDFRDAALRARIEAKATPRLNVLLVTEVITSCHPFLSTLRSIYNAEVGELDCKTKSRIVSWITTHLRAIALYPGLLYESAAKALVL
ncbi:hypothetical protein HPB47_015883 [Ixodes persulcatus]|uniref:Uncharacterized protein n=1 Tax=Ixodes persulcatus TaxID=34615 RepID=A0AC60QTI8_IXOPE|nr:hypothetical protein HPB47_015883 [Ixodes persulcatus]